MEIFQIEIKPSKAIFYALLVTAFFSFIIPAVTYLNSSSQFTDLSKKTQGDLFQNALLSTANEIVDHLWTEQKVYDFIQALSYFNFSSAKIENPNEESISLADGRNLKIRTIAVTLGGVMTLSDFFSLIQRIENERKAVFLYPTSINNLRDYKEIKIKFYLSPGIPQVPNYPLSVEYTKYGLYSLYQNRGDIQEEGITIPVFFDNRLYLGVFKKNEEAPVYLLVR